MMAEFLTLQLMISDCNKCVVRNYRPVKEQNKQVE